MFACIHVPDFPVEAIARRAPLLRERAVVVLEGKPPLVRVAALNDKARQLGLNVGMTKMQAAIFATEHGSSPDAGKPSRIKPGHIDLSPRKTGTNSSGAVVLHQRSPEQEKSAHAALLDIAHAFTPRVEDTADDRLLLDLCGLERLYGTAAKMAHELAVRVSTVGIEASIGIAANPDTAMHAACGFSGTTVIGQGEEAKRVATLPLQVLLDCFDLPHRQQASRNAADREREQLREQMLDTLERWGVRDFRTLSLLPEHALASRLGEPGARLQRLARGAEMRTLALCDPATSFEEALELESAVETLEPLSFVIHRLLEQLCARLGSRAMAAHELRIRLQLEPRVADEETTTRQQLEVPLPGSHNLGGNSLFERTLRLPVAMRDPKIFLKLLQLELAAHPPGAPVVKLWISALPAPPRSAQRGLFLPLTPEAEKLEITLARIISVVGEHRAGIARLLDSHRPNAFRMERYTAEPNEPEKAAALTLSDITNGPSLALRVFRPAGRLVVRMADGRPVAINSVTKTADTAQLHGKVLWSAGPWRSSGDWWTEHSPEDNGHASGAWDREEWDVAVDQERGKGVGVYRIYRDTGTGEWFVDACYD